MSTGKIQAEAENQHVEGLKMDQESFLLESSDVNATAYLMQPEIPEKRLNLTSLLFGKERYHSAFFADFADFGHQKNKVKATGRKEEKSD